MPKSSTLLSTASFGSPCSYELKGDIIVSRIFGLMTVQTIQMNDVQYLRLATRDEISMIYLLLNWLQFLPHRRSICPVYILQTDNNQSLFLKLDGRAHFKLRQAIGRKNERQKKQSYRLAA